MAFPVEALAAEDLAADPLPLAVDALPAVGLALPVDAFALPVDAFALPVAGLALPVAGLALPVDAFALPVDAFALAAFAFALAARPVAGFADAAEDLAVLAVGDFPVEEAVVDDGIAEDIALAASVSDLTAVSIALVATLIACSAVVIVLAEDVAFVAAVFSFAAADVTLVAADETVRGVGAAVVVRLAVAGRPVLPVLPVLPVVLVPAVPALADLRAVVPLAAGLAVARVVVFFAAPAVDDFAELVRLALAVRGRVGFLAAGVVGTDLPPSGSVTGSLIPRSIWFYTSHRLAHQSQQALWPQCPGRPRPHPPHAGHAACPRRLSATTSCPRPAAARRQR